MPRWPSRAGLPVPRPCRQRTQAGLRQMIPDYLTVANPVDNGAQFLISGSVEDQKARLRARGRRPGIDIIVIRAHRGPWPAHRPLRRGHRGLHRRDQEAQSVGDRTPSRPTREGFPHAHRRGAADVPVVPQLASRRCTPSPGTKRPSASFRPRKAMSSRLPQEALSALTDGRRVRRPPPWVPTRRDSCSSPSTSPWPERAWPIPPPRRPAWRSPSASRWS